MLVVCGDSFSYGTAAIDWPQIVAKNLYADLTNLSIVGASNVNICFQLQYALENLNPDYLVVSLSAANRFDIDTQQLTCPANILDFTQCVDEINTSYSHKIPSITSGNLASHSRNSSSKNYKQYFTTHSYRLSAQMHAWSINHLVSSFTCPVLLYRNIFPRFHRNKNSYKLEHYFGLKNFINSGPCDYESDEVRYTNHLSPDDNNRFAERVLNDFRELSV